MTIEFTMVQSIGFAVILLLIGRFLRSHISFFERFAIPSPVIGGFLFALINLLFHYTHWVNITFDTTLQAFFMVLFFTSIGFGASPVILKKAGPKVAIFLSVAIGLVILQNLVAVGLAPLLNVPGPIALMTGSTAMTGGHGTSAGIAPLVEAAGLKGAESVAYTAATFGLVAGSLIGGPIAARLIRSKNLANVHDKDKKDYSFLREKMHPLDTERMTTAFIWLLVAMFFGSYITDAINNVIQGWTSMAQFPSYLGPMIFGVLARWFSDRRYARKGGVEIVAHQEIEVVGAVSLSLFLAMALMSVKLWDLGSLAIPMIALLAAQTLLAYLYVRFVTFKAMGSTYDAAVLLAGHAGFGMGATPNGVANMESVTRKFGPSPTAFFVLPVVGGMFIDFFNVFIITLFLALV
ncbi:ESS family glutamate:Na+ symporter [Arcanobacterium wilhelmae]|uniref:Sodium/glutamate symporter n=1 Tax=Arcanobacterium wilhelmae TaxID=1803177 RepID=A0ABT9NBZ4_9ACTO|nr:sodium/glutamate symporter [Arcanobacterium wilhelmae]MDP9800736.1 ESS family glutamate:Na+ symporter [Arcanobacterium wilhelmae]WFN90134.1 sodium/glutamate symporter [Arcanobacterium wilhelmae]